MHLRTNFSASKQNEVSLKPLKAQRFDSFNIFSPTVNVDYSYNQLPASYRRLAGFDLDNKDDSSQSTPPFKTNHYFITDVY